MNKARALYHLVPGGGETCVTGNQWSHLGKTIKATWKDIGLGFFAILSLVLSGIVSSQHARSSDAAFAYPTLDLVSQKNTLQYRWWSKYSDPRDPITVEHKWSSIVPAHGVVAVDHRWAQSKRLPDSLIHPEDPSKKVYIIDAYHQMHCLTIVRKTFYQLSRGETLTFPIGHSRHCFDSLRQYVQCTAGDTLLYSWGLNTTGDGQERQCRDWGALSKWASEHTACYRDSDKPIPLLEHFGYCDNGDDGLTEY